MHYIYRITNISNQKCYIGYTNQEPPIKRWKQHLKNARKEKSLAYNSIFSKAIRKYGESSFSFEILFNTQDHLYCLKEMEPHYIRENHSYYLDENGGYNMTYGGKGGKPKGTIPWNKGKKGVQKGTWAGKLRPNLHNEESKKKMSIAAKRNAAIKPRDSSNRFIRRHSKTESYLLA